MAMPIELEMEMEMNDDILYGHEQMQRGFNMIFGLPFDIHKLISICNMCVCVTQCVQMC